MGLLGDLFSTIDSAKRRGGAFAHGLLTDPAEVLRQEVANRNNEAGQHLGLLSSMYQDDKGNPTFDPSKWSAKAAAAEAALTEQALGAVMGSMAPAKLLSDASGAPIKMYRGSPNVDPAPRNKDALVFLTANRDFAQNYAKGPNGRVHEFNVVLEKPFDASRGEGLKLWKQFVRDTDSPSWSSVGTDRGALPNWTMEPQLREWLARNKIDHDGIWFGESNGTASLAVPSMSQLSPAK